MRRREHPWLQAIRRVVTGTVVAAAVLLPVAAGTAAAADYPPPSCQLGVAPTTIAPGQTVTIATNSGCNGSGYAPNADVDLFFSSYPEVSLGTTRADATGGIFADVQVPANAAPGEHTIYASGPAAAGGVLVVSTKLTVDGAPTDPLAFTGSSTGSWPEVGAAAVVVGVVLVIVARRRVGRRATARS